jgi:hypothetical protein
MQCFANGGAFRLMTGVSSPRLALEQQSLGFFAAVL